MHIYLGGGGLFTLLILWAFLTQDPQQLERELKDFCRGVLALVGVLIAICSVIVAIGVTVAWLHGTISNTTFMLGLIPVVIVGGVISALEEKSQQRKSGTRKTL